MSPEPLLIQAWLNGNLRSQLAGLVVGNPLITGKVTDALNTSAGVFVELLLNVCEIFVWSQ